MLAGAAAIVLAVDTFLPWFEFRSGKLNAWQTFTFTEVVLAIVFVMAVTLVVVTLTARTSAAPVAAAVWTTVIGLIGTIWVLVAVLAEPGGALKHCYGSWLGLAATVAVLVAGWLSMRDERPRRGVDMRAPVDDLPQPLPPPDRGPPESGPPGPAA
jgi:hypothetical protein